MSRLDQIDQRFDHQDQKLDRRFDDQDEKLDGLLQWRYKIAGMVLVVSVLVSFTGQYILAKAGK